MRRFSPECESSLGCCLQCGSLRHTTGGHGRQEIRETKEKKEDPRWRKAVDMAIALSVPSNPASVTFWAEVVSQIRHGDFSVALGNVGLAIDAADYFEEKRKEARKHDERHEKREREKQRDERQKVIHAAGEALRHDVKQREEVIALRKELERLIREQRAPEHQERQSGHDAIPVASEREWSRHFDTKTKAGTSPSVTP